MFRITFTRLPVLLYKGRKVSKCVEMATLISFLGHKKTTLLCRFSDHPIMVLQRKFDSFSNIY